MLSDPAGSGFAGRQGGKMGTRVYVLLAFLFVALAATNYLWLSYDQVPPDWDESVHMVTSMRYHRILDDAVHHPDFSGHGIKETLRQLVDVSSFVYPPLVTFTGGLLIFIAGNLMDALAMTNIPFLAILSVSVFQIGKRIADERTGLLSVLMILLYPLVFGLTRVPMLDFALLAMTALSVYLLLYSDFFTHRTYTILFGLSLGLGMLTKPIFLNYMLIPVGRMVGYCVRERVCGELASKELWRRGLWALSALLLGVLIAGLWYGPHAHRLGVFRQIAATALWHPDLYDVETLLYYLRILIVEHIGLPFFIVFVFALPRFKTKATRFHAGLLLLWLAGLYVTLTLVPLKTPRQTIGLLLPIGLISAIGLSAMPKYRRVAIALVLFYDVIQFAALSLPRHVLADRMGGLAWAGHFRHAQPSNKADWQIDETLRTMDSEVRKIGVIADHKFVNGQTWAYFSAALELDQKVVKCRDHYQDFVENLASYDVVITKSDWAPITHRGNPNISADTNAILVEHFQDNIDRFALDRKTALPDGSELLVYRQKHSSPVARTTVP
jgi:Dolichyl-phosphate-mannose-protein mannosyltransferase